MRALLRGRSRQALLWAALFVTVVSTSSTVVVETQEPAMRWDGLIELVSGRNDSPPPNLNPPTPANGPSQMSRHAMSGDAAMALADALHPALALVDVHLSDGPPGGEVARAQVEG